MININQFKNNFKGGARKNKFSINIVKLNNKFNSILVQSASIPQFSLDALTVHSIAGKIKVAGGREVPDWDVTVMLDEDVADNGINELENWQLQARQMMSAEGSNDAHGVLNGYKSDAYLYQLDQKGNTIARYKLEGIWPKEIGQREFDYTDDDIVTCSITFSIDNVIRL